MGRTTKQARTIREIYNSLVDSLKSNALAIGIVVNPEKWSRYDYKKLFLDTVATGHAVQEQLFDSFKEDTEALVEILPIQIGAWFKDKMINLFEYDANNPRIIQLNTQTITYYYPNPNPALRIIKYCSVVKGPFGTTIVKVAAQANGAPLKLNSLQLASAQSFVNAAAIPGLEYIVVSSESDKIYLDLDVKYNGAYSATIESRVIDAIKNYFSSIPFDGKIKLSNLILAIKSVEGVGQDGDVVLRNVQARADNVAAGTGDKLVNQSTTLLEEWPSVAGYVIPETAIGFRLTDQRTGTTVNHLNLIPQ